MIGSAAQVRGFRRRAVVAAAVTGILALAAPAMMAADAASAADRAESRWNTQTGTVTGEFVQGMNITAVAFTPDGTRAYAVGVLPVQPGGRVGVIETAIDSASMYVDIAFESAFPVAVAIAPPDAAGQAGFIASSDSQILVMDVQNDVQSSTLVGYSGSNPVSIALRPDGKTGLITNSGSNSVSVIDVANRAESGTVIGWEGTEPWGIAIAPSGDTAYVTNRGDDTVSVLQWIPGESTFAQTGSIAGFDDPYGVAFTPDGAKAYVLNSGLESGGAGSVSIVDVATSTASPNPVAGFSGTNPSAIAITAEGDTAYITNSGSNSVSVVDVAADTEIGTVSDFDGVQPTGIALSPDGTKAYVANMGDTHTENPTFGTVSVLYVGPTPSPPGAPTITSVNAGETSIQVDFAPGTPGTFPDTDYTATVYEAGASTPVATGSWNDFKPALHIGVDGLEPGVGYTATVTANNPGGDAVSAMSSAVVTGTPPEFTNTSPPQVGVVNDFYTYTFTTSGSPTPTLAVTTPLPTGLGVSYPTPGSMTISGTPNAAWSGTITVQARNVLDTAESTVPLTISPLLEEPEPEPPATPPATPPVSPSPTAAPTAAGTPNGLAVTGGTDPTGAIVLAIGMLAAGGILITMQVKRRRTSHLR